MTMTTFTRLLTTLVCTSSISVIACSDVVQEASPFSEKQALCDLRPGKGQCTDIRKFQGPSLVTFEGVCNSLKSASAKATGYEEGATCPTAEMWGGCQTKNGDGSLQTNWFYKGDDYKTEDDAKKECDSNTTWVAPQ
jgi:hypothetical protein